MFAFPWGLGNASEPRAEDVRRLTSRIRQHGLFASLSPQAIAKLVPAFRIKQFRDEEISCHCSDASHEAFVILQGIVALKHRSGDTENVLELADFGGVFNVAGLVGGESGHTAARAMGRVEILAMDTNRLRLLLGKNPAIGYPVLRHLAGLLLSQYERHLDRCLKEEGLA